MLQAHSGRSGEQQQEQNSRSLLAEHCHGTQNLKSGGKVLAKDVISRISPLALSTSCIPLGLPKLVVVSESYQMWLRMQNRVLCI